MDVCRSGVTRYRPGDFMGAHVDDEARLLPWDIPHRGVSLSVPMSAGTDYEGGSLELLSPGGMLSPGLGRGDAVVFGSSVPRHVSTVDEGERWVLLMWVYTNHKMWPVR